MPEKAEHGASGAREPEAQRPLPYVRRLEERGHLGIWIVDGDYVRKNVDEEFSNFGHHWTIEEIPENEVWLDEESHPDGQRFCLGHVLVERKLMQRGKSYEQARVVADNIERELRSRAGDLARARHGDEQVKPEAMHERLWKALPSGLHVWFVDGRLVRSCYDIEFTEGGHDYVYEFVPMNEIWIDDDIHEDERGFVLFHELHERNLMAKGMDYDSAHADSSRLERHYRNHPPGLHEALIQEGWA